MKVNSNIFAPSYKNNIPGKQVAFKGVFSKFSKLFKSQPISTDEFIKRVHNVSNSDTTEAHNLLIILTEKLVKPTVKAFKDLGKAIKEKKLTPIGIGVAKSARKRWVKDLTAQGYDVKI